MCRALAWFQTSDCSCPPSCQYNIVETENTVTITKVVAAKVKLNLAASLELITMFLRQNLDDGGGILCCKAQLINVSCNIFVDVSVVPHPDVILCLGR